MLQYARNQSVLYLRPLTNKNKQLESLFQEATLEQPSWRALRAYQGLEILDTGTPALQVLPFCSTEGTPPTPLPLPPSREAGRYEVRMNE